MLHWQRQHLQTSRLSDFRIRMNLNEAAPTFNPLFPRWVVKDVTVSFVGWFSSRLRFVGVCWLPFCKALLLLGVVEVGFFVSVIEERRMEGEAFSVLSIDDGQNANEWLEQSNTLSSGHKVVVRVDLHRRWRKTAGHRQMMLSSCCCTIKYLARL